ncbi:MAG: TlpA disulfide reductase family protein [Ferruginibacter sp.]
MKGLCFTGVLFLLASCGSNPSKQPVVGSSSTRADSFYATKPESVLKDFNTWYSYTYYNIKLAREFTALGTDSSNINKTDFLNKLVTGKYIALKTTVKENKPVYRLFFLPITANKDISAVVSQMAANEMFNFKKEGTTLPAYRFTDIDNQVYTAENVKGKYLLLKCWFIHCKACVAEFPQLNKLVAEYKNNSDIIFVSLAMDSSHLLRDFLKTHPFSYKIVAGAKDYMLKDLGLTSFPTHILVGPSGKIIKVANEAEDIIAVLEEKIRT